KIIATVTIVSRHRAVAVGPQGAPKIPAAEPTLDAQRVRDTLARFLSDWPEASAKDRVSMARFFGFFRYVPALPSLRAAAEPLSGEDAVASLRALALLGDVGSAELFRKVLRSRSDCELIRLSGATLADWRDDHSYPLLVSTLLTTDCSDTTPAVLVRALAQIRHPHHEDLLFFVMNAASAPTVRLAAAAALAPKAAGPRIRPAETLGLDTIAELQVTTPFPDPVSDPKASLAFWGLAHFNAGNCRRAAQAATRLLEGRDATDRKRIALSLSAASIPCLSQARDSGILAALRDAIPHGEQALAVPNDSLPPALPEVDAMPTPWVDWIVQLATRFALWEDTRSMAQFAFAVERMEYARRRGVGPVSPAEEAASAPGKPVRVPRLPLHTLEELSADWSEPDRFEEYQFPGGQPEWWPDWIDITIDDGPRPARLRPILDVLDASGVKVTFFFIGSNVARQWGNRPQVTRDLLARISASGHRIGYHSINHDTSLLAHLQARTAGQIADDIRLFDQIVSVAAGTPWEHVYGRLPGGMGARLKHVNHGFDLAGLKAPVHWTLQEPTWGPSTSVKSVKGLARQLLRSRKRTVILLHEYQGVHKQLAAFIRTVENERRPVAAAD
ncbi:MAG: polysaccharide deacetylase family protein, partial [Deltaproteobacteria bacterium]|nr:polysaccharide deacetylase family protein [Deltaproteobacteria bacterium]